MRLIDADEVKNKLREEIKNNELPLLKRTLFKLLLEFVGDETVFKTVDAVEVVRCKDCKHCLKDNSERAMHLCVKSRLARSNVKLDDYCSYGEKGGTKCD